MKKFIIIALLIIAGGIIFISCTKQVSEKQNSILVPTATNPYSMNSNVVGGVVYFIVQIKIPENNSSDMNAVWTNPTTGKPYSDDGKVYYNPSKLTRQIVFGVNVSANIIEFRNSVNAKIDQQGYAIVSDFEDGGPNYSKWELVN